MRLDPGALLGPYEIVAFIGAGGMGEVYRGRDTRLDRDVAIKVLAASLAPNQNSQDRFEREARTISRLNHPNVCTVYDVGRQGDMHYLVMEFLEGRTLASHLESGALVVDRAVEYAIQIADGLAKAHSLGVIHRDLKPANVMVTSEGPVKILDFGLAKRFGASESDKTAVITLTEGLMVGTVAYMAPEQTSSGRVDVRTDVFAFGVVMYEMFGGARPFDGGNVISTIRRINDDEPLPLHTLQPAIPQSIEAIIAKALQKDPADRFQRIADLRQALRAAASRSQPGEYPAPNASYPALARASSTFTQHRGKWAIAATMLLVLVVAGLMIAAANNRRDAVIEPTIVPAVTTAPTDAIGWARHGQTLLLRHDRPAQVDQAIAAYNKAIAIDPSSALAYAGIAEAFSRKDATTPDPQWKRLAADNARKAVDLNPDLAVSQLAYGIVLQSEGQRDEAYKALLRARDLDPRNASVLRMLGEFYQQTDAVTAEKMYNDAIAIAPDDWRTHQFLGFFYYRKARYLEAIAEWERARDLTPDNVLVFRNLGAAYHMVDRVDEAAAAFQRALEIQPTATTYNNLATLRYFQGRYGDAAAAFQKAVDLNPQFYLYWGNLGDALRWTSGHDAEARDAFARATTLGEERLAKAPADLNLRSSIAGYLAKRGDRERALEHVRILEQAKDRQPAVYFKTALVYELTGDRDAALRDLEMAIKSGYALREVVNEPELVKLRGDARYHRMIARFDK